MMEMNWTKVQREPQTICSGVSKTYLHISFVNILHLRVFVPSINREGEASSQVESSR